MVILECDSCHSRFERSYKLSWTIVSRHFCSRSCSDVARRVGGSSHSPDKVKTRIDKTKNTLRARYGFENPTQVRQFVEKRQVTWSSLYGVDHPFKTVEIREKQMSTMVTRYGVVHAMLDPLIVQKRHNTLKKRQWYTRQRSKVEDRFFVALASMHLVVERDKEVDGKAIDFYLPCLDVYVQFDGVYWHGLDRPIEEIAEHRSRQDVTIHSTFLRDRAQDAWFAKRSMKLIRVTDLEFKIDAIACLHKIGTCPGCSSPHVSSTSSVTSPRN